ncbi:hypothetical protein EDD91_0732 [Streptomyces sp. KS 21]|nr:hypothetical protein EDD91_0732 [Streptomyces sp. KS 21]
MLRRHLGAVRHGRAGGRSGARGRRLGGVLRHGARERQSLRGALPRPGTAADRDGRGSGRLARGGRPVRRARCPGQGAGIRRRGRSGGEDRVPPCAGLPRRLPR